MLPLSDEWVEIHHCAELPFYWNRLTNDTTWVKPDGMDTAWLCRKIISESGQILKYYYRRADGHWAWELPAMPERAVPRPTTADATQQSAAALSAENVATTMAAASSTPTAFFCDERTAAMLPLSDEWVEIHHCAELPFYWNRLTNDTTWIKPDGMDTAWLCRKHISESGQIMKYYYRRKDGHWAWELPAMPERAVPRPTTTTTDAAPQFATASSASIMPKTKAKPCLKPRSRRPPPPKAKRLPPMHETPAPPSCPPTPPCQPLLAWAPMTLGCGLDSQEVLPRESKPQEDGGSHVYGDEALRDEATSSTTAATTAPPAPFEASAQARTRLDESLAKEVRRIQGARDFTELLGFADGEQRSWKAAESKYRQLMRLLHPDKRTEQGEARAGGKAECVEAYNKVQDALQKAREAWGT